MVRRNSWGQYGVFHFCCHFLVHNPMCMTSLGLSCPQSAPSCPGRFEALCLHLWLRPHGPHKWHLQYLLTALPTSSTHSSPVTLLSSPKELREAVPGAAGCHGRAVHLLVWWAQGSGRGWVSGQKQPRDQQLNSIPGVQSAVRPSIPTSSPFIVMRIKRRTT